VRKNSTHVRVPHDVALRLAWYAGYWQDRFGPPQQGNHEHPSADKPPLWKVIERLLDLEDDHRRRGKKKTSKQGTGLEPIAEPRPSYFPPDDEPVCEE